MASHQNVFHALTALQYTKVNLKSNVVLQKKSLCDEVGQQQDRILAPKLNDW
jgi:hypothetical protein